jgi:hypothetical protein
MTIVKPDPCTYPCFGGQQTEIEMKSTPVFDYVEASTLALKTVISCAACLESLRVRIG